MKRKICICGHFGFGQNLLNGQTVKTKIMYEWLSNKFGDEVVTIDTHGSKTKQIVAVLKSIKMLRRCENIIILPAHNGIKIFAPILAFFNRIYKRKLQYVVIGGWLPDFIKNKKFLTKSLKEFSTIYVETKIMKRHLLEQNFENIQVMPNCKNLKVLSKDEMLCSNEKPFKICTFSRVMREKGIADIVELIREINQQADAIIYELDIYGQIDIGQQEWFENLSREFPSYIKYKGQVAFDKSVEVLKGYFLLVFPTRFYTEGIPGTIIDAYAAGVPVVASRWESFEDIVEEGVTGFGYEFDNISELKNKLLEIAESPWSINNMKENCLIKANDYEVNRVFADLVI